MQAFTFGYFLCTLVYFLTSSPSFSSLSDSWRHYVCVSAGSHERIFHPKQKQSLYLVLYNTDVWAAAIWGPNGVTTSLCVNVCLCVTGRWAKLKEELRNWGAVVKTPSRELGISRESGKNIPTVINQNFADTNDHTQRDCSPSVSLCHLHPKAMSHPPALPPYRPSPYATQRDWPNGPRANS
ncbi:hypothetical protein NQZ68_033811 [Xyrichtys novacula]|uniref:Secreted protein n=1 Tax=Xyrichtys novacula TaxID=13765 RepID=A0AAV1GD37_XYRNO|nr:hypothetical protein NQZ68_033811 [Xyrichtys novacula]